MTHLLDTNICIWLMRGVRDVAARLEAGAPESFAISVITFYELALGVRKSSHPAREEGRLQRVIQPFQRIDFDAEAALEAAQIRAALEAQGCGIGPYDTLLAGHARSRGLIMVTDNFAEFSRVPDLQVEHWHR